MNRKDDPFAGARPVAPPFGLRDRALRAGRAASLAPSIAATARARRLGLGAFDLAWITALVLLALANLIVPGASAPSVGENAGRWAPSREERSLAREVGIPASQLADASGAPRPRHPDPRGDAMRRLLEEPM